MKIFQWILIIFFFLLPFHALGVTFLNSLFFDVTTPPPFFLSGWKELFLAFYFLFSGFWILGHFQETKKEFDTIDSLIFIFSLVGLLIAIWKIPDFSFHSILQIFLGIKYDFFFLWTLFICKHLPWNTKFFNSILHAILFSGIFIIVFAYIQKNSSADFLIQFGFFDAPSVDTVEKPASFCQLLEHTNTCRLTSTFAGPIRFGAFLVFLSGVILILFQKIKTNSIKNTAKKITLFFLFISIFPLLFWTYSRGAWIAEIILIIISVFAYFKISLFHWKTIFSVIALISLGIVSIFLSGKSESLLFREGSTNKHIEGITESWEIIQTEPAGQGLGTAGPASANTGDADKFLNENWYLQIFTELGMAGGIIYFLLILTIGTLLYRSQSKLFPLFFAFSIMALFTHLWEESALAYILFALIGVELRQKKMIGFSRLSVIQS